jgi:hypothetical protein
MQQYKAVSLQMSTCQFKAFDALVEFREQLLDLGDDPLLSFGRRQFERLGPNVVIFDGWIAYTVLFSG